MTDDERWWETLDRARQYLDDHADGSGDPEDMERCRETLDVGSSTSRLVRADPPVERGKPRPPG